MSASKQTTVEAFPLMSVRVVIDGNGVITERIVVYKNGATVHAQYNNYKTFESGIIKITRSSHTIAEAFLALHNIDIHEGDGGWQYVVY